MKSYFFSTLACLLILQTSQAGILLSKNSRRHEFSQEAPGYPPSSLAIDLSSIGIGGVFFQKISDKIPGLPPYFYLGALGEYARGSDDSISLMHSTYTGEISLFLQLERKLFLGGGLGLTGYIYQSSSDKTIFGRQGTFENTYSLSAVFDPDDFWFGMGYRYSWFDDKQSRAGITLESAMHQHSFFLILHPLRWYQEPAAPSLPAKSLAN